MYESRNIPDHVREALERYFVHGFAPGGFCSAVLANDLMSAVQKADHWNQLNLSDIANWVLHNAPNGSWGSYEHVQGWLDKNEFFQENQKRLIVKILKEED